MSFKKYYEFYLSLHQDKRCRRCHVLGQLTTISYCILCIYTASWLGLVVAPFVIYPFAWFGHFYFEKNSPLAWEGMSDYGWTTLKAKVCDWLMFRDWLTGRLER